MEALEQAILQEYEKIRHDARAIVWDLRSNIGGATPVGLSIVSGMPGARRVSINRCTRRVPDTTPPRYDDAGGYEVIPNDRFAFDGPVAVLIDGRTVSAGDYFALAVRQATDAILVGTPTAGAYGGSGAAFPVEGELGLTAGYDPYRCNDLVGQPLETRAVEPHVFVEYNPDSLRRGHDTVLERAVEEVLRDLSPQR